MIEFAKQKSRRSVSSLQSCLCSGSHVVVATCPTGHPLHKQLRCVARHALPEGLRICYAGDLCSASDFFGSWGEGKGGERLFCWCLKV